MRIGFRILILMLLLPQGKLTGQELERARKIITDLSAPRMQGRGYVKKGDHRAANYIRKEFIGIGLQELVKDYYQSFPVQVNTFPGAMKLKINGKSLLPGYDFIVDPASPRLRGTFKVHQVNYHTLLDDEESVIQVAAGKVLVIDSRALQDESVEEKRRLNAIRQELIFRSSAEIRAIVDVGTEKLNFGASGINSGIPGISLKASAYPDTVRSFRATITNRFKSHYNTGNLAGYVPGTVHPDSFVVFTAHYDHLGLMGRHNFFPGANDNASGVALLISLADYFQHHPQPYSVVFLAFSGEEAGLLGSGYFADHPPIKLSSVRFLINLDLVGTGSEGITVVNGSIYSEAYADLFAINEQYRLVEAVRKRGEACNSDHCSFYRKGVPCFFIYTMGGIKAYHDFDDRPETLPLTAFEGLKKLLVLFVSTFFNNLPQLPE